MVVEKILYTDNLRNGTDKINAAIDLSNESKTESASAKMTAEGVIQTAGNAVVIANAANTKSDATANQLQTVIIESGTSDAEILAARIDGNTAESFPTVGGRLDNVSSQLADKAEQSYAEATNLRVDNLVIPISAENANIEVTDAHVSTVKNKTFTTVRNRFEEIEGAIHSTVKNLAPNGDFSNGTTGWLASNATITNVSGRLKILANGQYGGVDVAFNAVAGRKYYVCGLIDGIVGMSSFFVVGMASTIKSITKTGSERLSQIITATSTTHSVRFFDLATSAWTDFYIDNVMILDLTEMFGVGKEPTASKVDAWLSYYNNSFFDGTIKNKDTEKALVQKNFFDPIVVVPDVSSNVDTTIYNKDKGLRRWRAALAHTQSSTSKIVNLNVVGTSIATGGVATDFLNKGWVYLLKKHFTSKFEDVGFGVMSCGHPYAMGVGTEFWTYAGTWANDLTKGIMGESQVSSTVGSTATVSFNGTSVAILAYADTLGGKFTATVDGGAPIEFNTYSATTVPTKEFLVTGLVSGQHTLVITQNEASKNVVLIGIYPKKGQRGVRVNNASRSGGSASAAVNTVNNINAEIGFWNPSLTIIEFMTNDYNGQVSLATYKSQMQTLITEAKKTGDVVLLPNGIRVENKSILQTDYLNVLKQLATENNIVLLDVFNRWGGNFEYADVTLDFLYDTVHPNDAGHQDISNFLLKNIIE